MDTGKSRGALLPIIVTLAALIGLCLLGLLFASGAVARSIPASEGMPQAQPGQVIVQQPAPTPAPEIVPTRDVAPPPATIITPTEQPVNPPPFTGTEGDVIGSGIEPIPADPNDAGATGDQGQQPQGEIQQPANSGLDESVQPYPAGSSPSTSSRPSGSNTGSAGLGCGRRVVHVVQAGQNIFRIALRYDTTINAIVWRNGIDDVRFVRPGTRLVVVTCEQR
jgi:hypothetical protein